MQGMSGGLGARIGRFVDEHGVYCAYIRTREAFHVVKHSVVADVLKEKKIISEIFNICILSFYTTNKLCNFHNMHILSQKGYLYLELVLKAVFQYFCIQLQNIIRLMS